MSTPSSFVDDMETNESKTLRRSVFIIQNAVFVGLCCIFLLLMIITPSLTQKVPVELSFLIIISIIAVILVLIIRCVTVWKTLKRIPSNSILTKRKKDVAQIVYIVSIGLTLFTVLFVSSIMAPHNLGYGSFVLFLIKTFTFIGLLALIIYLWIIGVRFLWRKCSFIRGQLSPGIVSFFLSTFLVLVFFILNIAIMASSPLDGFSIGLALLFLITFSIGGIATISFRRSKLTRILVGLLSIIACLGLSLLLRFYLNDEMNMKIAVIVPSERFPQNLTRDPSRPGNYSYSSLTYGSGTDQRDVYGSKASIKTPTVDLSSIITISADNKGTFRYDESTIALNGKIWYPTNKTGPHPVVVFLHGNHLPTESSENGYEYLGVMLASQGFISVSIDENILNGAPSSTSPAHGAISKMIRFDFGSNLAPEYIARALIVLETLKQFRLWNEQASNLFYKQFDLANVALMGHSRAGEAIVIAYMLNKLNYLPEYPSNVSFNDYHFGIKVLFSISGTNDAYMPLGRVLQFDDVTMFGIHGMYDGDVSSFLIQAKLTNLKFTSNSSEYHFKSSLYVHQANHGQFNQDWGRYDLPAGLGRFMNVRPLMTMEQQQHICKIYMSALMNAVLKNQTHYRVLFEDYRSALSYLPHTNYISTFQDSNETVLADFENYDLTMGTIDGSKINTTHLALWSSVYVKVYQSAMLLLQPKANLRGTYTLLLQQAKIGSTIRFMIGRTSEGRVDNLTVRLLYEDGSDQSFVVHVLPALTKKVFKTASEVYVTAVQTIALPIVRAIVGLQFVVNGTDAQFLIDNIVIVH